MPRPGGALRAYRPRVFQAKAPPPLTGAPVAAAILSGLLYFLSFPSWNLYPLAWVALVPLLWAIQGRRPRHAFLLGTLAGAAGFGGLLFWILRFGVVAWVALWGSLAVYWGVFAALCAWIAGGWPLPWRLWFVPIAWTAVEFARSIGPLGFPWGLLGLSQASYLPALQVASLGGVYGVSFLIVLANSTVLHLVAFLWEGGSPRRAAIVLPAAVIVLSLGFGFVRLRHSPVVTSSSAVTAAAVQPNVPPLLKGDLDFAPEAWQVLSQLTERASAQKASLIVFPESAVPGDLFGPGGRLPEVSAWARKAQVTMLVSSYEGGKSNLAVAIAPDGSVLGRYAKMRLVAFGEAGTEPGREQVVLRTPAGNLGVLICFESIFPDMSRTLVRRGADLLVVITNDGWFGKSAGPAQHAQAAVLRAVETGRAVIRAANTGISMLIDPYGRVLARQPLDTADVLVGRVSRRSSLTPYAHLGDLFALTLLALTVLGALPGTVRFLGEEAAGWDFWLALRVLLLPGALFLLLRRVTPFLGAYGPWASPLVMLLVTRLASAASGGPIKVYHGFSRTRGRGDLWRSGVGGWRGFWVSLTLGVGLVSGFAYTLYSGYATWEVPIIPIRPPDGWVLGGIRYILAGISVEVWLRGVVFEAVARWQTWRVAWVLTSLMGVLIQAGLPAEAWVWALLTGVPFGLIRALTGSALGLGVAHGMGALLLWFLLSPR